jgi:hypothetical protein
MRFGAGERGRKGPARIISVRQLDPGFRPRWHTLEIRLFKLMILLIALLLIGGFSGTAWLAMFGFYGLGCAFVSVFALRYGSDVMAALGYWFPPLALRATQLDTWLERDLEWKE